MDTRFVDSFAKDCAKNYQNGVEFSVRFIWGEISSTYNFPRDIEQLRHLSTNRLRQVFLDCLEQFMDKVVTYGTGKHQLNIQYLPLQSRDLTVMTTFDRAVLTSTAV